MWTEEQFIALEQEERVITDEAILIMLLVLAGVRGNIEKELRDFYSKYGKDGVVTYAEARKWISEQDHRRRLTALFTYVGGEFLTTLGKLETHFREFLTSIVTKEGSFFGISLNVDKLLEKPWGIDELYWLERLENDINLWQGHINKDIKHAILQRRSLEEVIMLMDTRFNSIDKALKNLGLSESTAIGSLSRQEIFKELGIAKYQFFTKPDERRCDICGAMHGLVFPVSVYEVGVTASPIHPRCRCWEVPIME